MFSNKFVDTFKSKLIVATSSSNSNAVANKTQCAILYHYDIHFYVILQAREQS